MGMPNKVLVKVPASTANLGPGFDTLGMALNLYAWIEMSIAKETTIELLGEQVEGIPADKTNLIYEVAQEVFAQAGVHHPELHITMYSEIPLTRGLGSSASAIIGGMAAANALIGSPLSEDTIFQLATAREAHPDNVGASLFGGLVIAFWDGERAEYVQVDLDERLEVLVIVPEFHLPTGEARDVLPEWVKHRDAVYNVGHSSLLVAALMTGKFDLIRYAMKDVLHQPYRQALIPGMEQMLQGAVEHGALGIALSGAGPTLLALVDTRSTRKRELEQFLRQVCIQEQIEATTMWLKPSAGVEVETSNDSAHRLADQVKGEALI